MTFRRRWTRRMLAARPSAARRCSPRPPPTPRPRIECVTTSGAYAVGVNCRQVEVDGHPRQFVAYVPATAPATGPRAPVVFMFHGSSGTGEQFLRMSGWREQADATGLVAVFPTGLRYRILENGRRSTKWNDGDLAAEIDLSERPRGYPATRRSRPTTSASSTRCWPSSAPTCSSIRAASTPPASPTARTSPPIWRSSARGCSPPRGSRPAGCRARHACAADPDVDVARHARRPRAGAHRARGAAARPGRHPHPAGPRGRARDAPRDARAGRRSLRRGARSRSAPSCAGPPPTRVFRFTMLDGVRHQYPNGRNNPAGFAAAPEFWRFFAEHPLR